jgi:hypothetical protein
MHVYALSLMDNLLSFCPNYGSYLASLLFSPYHQNGNGLNLGTLVFIKFSW